MSDLNHVSPANKETKQAERRELAARFLQARIQHYGYEAIKVSEIETVIDTTLLLADTLIRKTS